MKMKANKILLILLSVCVLGLSSCRDQFAEMNQSPSDVTTAEPSFMLTRCELSFQVNDYLYWFYNQLLYSNWSQLGASGTFSEGTFGQGTAIMTQDNYITMLNYRNDINDYVEKFDHPELKAYSAMCGVLAIFGGIFSSDINGDIQYTEACMYKFGGPLTPAYDKVEALYDLWVKELDDYIAVFQDKSQNIIAKQDLFFNGDLAKWARLANTIKLKIAVRLYNNNPEKAKQIAQAVVGNSAGYIDSIEDSFLFHKADATTGGDDAYGIGDVNIENFWGGSSGNVINFMLASKDPRVRYFYRKNGYNSKIVQCFIDNGKYENLPPYVKDVVVLDEDGNFKEWGGMGEPWVRYFGHPIVFKDSDAYKAISGTYYDTGTRYQLTIGDASKSYGIYSSLNGEMLLGRVDYSVPTTPDGPVIQDNDDVVWWQLVMGAGETNLYLAELAQLGAALPKSAEEYYNRGVQLSVQEWDNVAAKNKIPYYKTTYNYDPNEGTIELKDGELDAMMATDAVKFTGTDSEKLEKIYLQQLMNFTLMPDDQFVTARRSGYPKIGSSLLPFVKFDEIELTAIPRRFSFPWPLPTDVMYDIRTANLQEQGFTPGSNQSGIGFPSSTVLNTERLWQDKNAPQWGAGK